MLQAVIKHYNFYKNVQCKQTVYNILQVVINHSQIKNSQLLQKKEKKQEKR